MIIRPVPHTIENLLYQNFDASLNGVRKMRSSPFITVENGAVAILKIDRFMLEHRLIQSSFGISFTGTSQIFFEYVVLKLLILSNNSSAFSLLIFLISEN